LSIQDAMSSAFDPRSIVCPLPASDHEQILLGHGSGGRLTAELIQQLFLPAWDNPLVAALEDQAVLPRDGFGEALPEGGRLALTTDAYVVRPLVFPGGDIGTLAVHGTVNDLAVGGAIPRYLSAAFILEEGLPLATLRQIVASMADACRQARVVLAAGDTKVVDRGKGDGLYVVTTGLGYIPAGRDLSVRYARPGDWVLVSGPIAEHGMAILAAREELPLETPLVSDTAPLCGLVEVMLASGGQIRWMRDPTRGGLSSALNELASASRVGVQLEEAAIPIRPEVHAACELLGLDPLHVACEGRLVAVVAPADGPAVLAAMQQHPLGAAAARIGTIVADHPGTVVMHTRIGGARVVPLLAGQPLPRIC
jgi:hydrogenase expression/formation protein HypE